MLNWYNFVKSQPNFIIFGRLTPEWITNKAMHVLSTTPIARFYTQPCRSNVVRFLCCFKMKFAHELCWHGKQLNSDNHTKLYWSVYRQCSICPPLSQKNIKFGWEFTKLYQSNIKQVEMCSLFWACTSMWRTQTATSDVHSKEGRTLSYSSPYSYRETSDRTLLFSF